MLAVSRSARASVSDLQAAITQLRANGGGVLECEPGATYVCFQPLNLDDLAHVTIRGNRSRWLYVGAGSDFVSLKSAVQVSLEQVRFTATNPAFTGHLVTTGWSAISRDTSHLTFDGCEFAGLVAGGARAGLRLDRGIFVGVQHCQFSGTNWGILGVDGSYSNVVSVRDSAFYSLRHAGIYNAGEAWTIESNGFEPLVSGQACAYSQDITLTAKAFAFNGNWCGDITVPGGAWVSVHASGLTASGNLFGSAGAPTDPVFRLFGVQGGLITAAHNQASNQFVEFMPEMGLSRNVTLISNDLGIGAVGHPEYCTGLRMVNNFGQADC